MAAEIVVHGADETAGWLERAAGTMGAYTSSLMAREGQLLLAAVVRNASGRPGPEAPTGDYRRSITLSIDFHDGMHTATVGTNKPQALRLENGFRGTDSLGRRYNQPPYPHFGPAADERAPEFEAAAAAMVAEVMGR